MRPRGVNATVVAHDNAELITNNIGLVVTALGVLLALLTLIVALAHLRHDGWTLRFFTRRSRRLSNSDDIEMIARAPGVGTGMCTYRHGEGNTH